MFAGNVSGNQNIDSILEAFKNEKVRERSEIHFFTHGARQIENVKKCQISILHQSYSEEV